MSRRRKGEFFLDDDVEIIAGIGKKTAERLRAEGLATVQALAGLDDEAIRVLAAKQALKLSTNVLQKFRDLAKGSQNES